MNDNDYLYSQPVLDFITVCTEYCKFLEQCENKDAEEFTRVMRGLLPMLYLKATLIGSVPEEPGWNERKLPFLILLSGARQYCHAHRLITEPSI